MPERAACGGAQRRRLDKFTKPDDDAMVFSGIKGGPLRRSGFNKLTRWVDVARSMSVPGLHFHDLRNTGNTLAADMGVSLRNLMARMGHDNERAALIYQHVFGPARCRHMVSHIPGPAAPPGMARRRADRFR